MREREREQNNAKVCEECGQAFMAKRTDARFCSRECNKRWYYKEHREQIDEWTRQWAKDHPEERKAIQARNEAKHGAKYRRRKKERYDAITADPVLQEERHRRRLEYYDANRDRVLEIERQRRIRDPFAQRYYQHGRVDWRELFQSFWDAQDGKCYLCGDELRAGKERGVHLDHDHKCHPLARSCAVCRRGLACPGCNALIGHAKDDPARLRRIADNLERANAGVEERRLAAAS
jgi:hypothetical protein